MSEGSRRSRVTITLGRSGQVVNRAASDIDDGYELPRVGTKRSVKERLGNPLDSSVYGGEEVVSKRQRGEASFSGNGIDVNYWIHTSACLLISDPPLFVTKICRSVEMISDSN
jgi:hypothetical protein